MEVEQGKLIIELVVWNGYGCIDNVKTCPEENMR